MRYLLYITLLYSMVFANISFTETRYMSALDMDRQLKGSVTINKTNMIINYTTPQQETITYLDDKVTILKDEELKEYSFEEYPQASFMGLIIKAMVTDNYTPIEEFFTITTQKEITTFTSKPIVTSTIKTIELSKKDDKKIVTMYMSNQDKITIETTN